jgi:four helix bundle protein
VFGRDGGWRLVAGGGWLVAGGWWLVAGGWWLVAGAIERPGGSGIGDDFPTKRLQPARMLPYERLLVWQEAHAFAIDCFRASARWTDYWLQRQVRRASESVAANLVEGSSHLSEAEFARFIGLALGSARETEYHLRFARDVSVLAVDQASVLLARANRISRMLQGLRTTVRRGVNRRA